MPQLDKLIFLDQLIIFFIFFICFYLFINYSIIPFYFYIFYSRILYFSVLNRATRKLSRFFFMKQFVSFELLIRFLNLFSYFFKRASSFLSNKFFIFKLSSLTLLFLLIVHTWFFYLLFQSENLYFLDLNNVSLPKFEYLLF